MAFEDNSYHNNKDVAIEMTPAGLNLNNENLCNGTQITCNSATQDDQKWSLILALTKSSR